METFLSSVDRIGKSFTFTFGGKETFTTAWGGIISIFQFIGLLVLLFYFGRDIYFKQEPEFNS